jgi:hypothetical protein
VAQKAGEEAEEAKEAKEQAEARVGEVENALQHQEKKHREELDALRANHFAQIKEVRDGESSICSPSLITFLTSCHLTIGSLRSQG